MKVLILSCSTGGGHNSCAKYIESELKSNGISCDFKNYYDIVNVKADGVTEKLYLSSLKRDGKVFKNVYKLGELYRKSGVTSPVYLVNKLHANKLYKYIKDNGYDLVVTSHLFPGLALTAIRKHIDEDIKFIMVSTDYEPCPFIEEIVADYLVIQKGLKKRYLEVGCKSKCIYESGIPVSSDFVFGCKDIRKSIGLSSDDKVILIMLGSMGFGNVDEILEDIISQNDCKVIVVCGNNKELYERLVNMKNDDMIVYGFVNNINDLIYSSDIVMSKPGGLSSTEIVSIGKPLIHMFAIPGIETYNTNYFEKCGMSLKCDDKRDIIDGVHELLNNKKLRDMMVKCQNKYINKYSARDLVNLIIGMNND